MVLANSTYFRLRRSRDDWDIWGFFCYDRASNENSPNLIFNPFFPTKFDILEF